MGIRSLAERISKRIVLRRRLPAEFGGGRLFVSPGHSGLRFWRRDLWRVDPSLLRVAQEFIAPGMTVWDVGANIGLFTFCAAGRAGPGGAVLAIEADVDNVATLLRSRRQMDRRSYAKVEVLPVAVSGPGQRFARFQIATRSRTTNALAGYGLVPAGEFSEERQVPVFTVDELLNHFEPPAFVKVDVEGAEPQVLAGAERLLRDVRPALFLEVAPESPDRQALATRLAQFGYRMFDTDEPKGSRKPHALPPWNCLCLPEALPAS